MSPFVLVKKEDPYAAAKREIEQIVADKNMSARQKAGRLGVRSVDYLLSKTGSAGENKAISKLFQDAREEMRVWGIIHEITGESEEKKAVGLVQIEDRLLSHAIENDASLRIDQKVHWLYLVSKTSPERQAGLRDVLRRQMKLLSPISVPRQPREEPAPLAPPKTTRPPAAVQALPTVQSGVLTQAKIGVAQVMAHKWVAGYSKRHGHKLGASAKSVVEAHWADITRDVDKLWANRGKQFEYEGLRMWGPSPSVTLKDLTVLVSLSYLNEQRSGLNAHFLQSIMGKESNFRATNLDVPAGSGLTQMTSIGVAGVVEKADSISVKLQSWGHAALDEHIGYVSRRKRWESLVQAEKLVRVKVGKGKKAHYKNKAVRYEPDFSNLEGKLVRGPKFGAYMADPANIIELTTALLIDKGAHPGMSREDMRSAASKYNGNNALNASGVRVRDQYSGEVVTRVKWEGQP